jgi:hypothetical protein
LIARKKENQAIKYPIPIPTDVSPTANAAKSY